MSTGNTPRDDADFEAFLARQSPLSTVYDAIEPVQPPEVLDAKILAMAKGAGAGASAKAPAAAKPVPPSTGSGAATAAAAAKPAPGRAGAPAAPKPAAAPAPAARPATVAVDDDDDAPPVRRPRWLVPAALAASVLVAIGIGVSLLDPGPALLSDDSSASSRLGSIFAKRARERSEADKASAEAAAAAARQEAEVELAPLPPPPVFEAEGPQVEDLEKAIALIRRELVLANQLAATAEEARAREQALTPNGLAGSAAAGKAGSAADAAPSSAPVATPAEAAAAGVVQPRDRRLAKILELYDGGNPELAADSLEIFLRDFEDDPISQRILDAQPRATDVAVE